MESEREIMKARKKEHIIKEYSQSVLMLEYNNDDVVLSINNRSTRKEMSLSTIFTLSNGFLM